MAKTKPTIEPLFTKYQIFMIVILSIIQFTVVLDFMVLSPLGEQLMSELKITPAQFSRVVSAYAIFAGLSGLLTAGFADRFDRKKLELGIDEDTLGIQIRGTDKKQELPEIQIQSIFDSIDKVDKHKIFVATDDKYYLDGLLNRYGERIVYDNSLQISSGSESIHHNCLNRSHINEEVLSSVYLLSNCSHFLYSFSNVSLLSLIMGVNNFQFVDYLNK